MARPPPTSGGAPNGSIFDLMRTIVDNEIHLSSTIVNMGHILNHSMTSQAEIAHAMNDSLGLQLKDEARILTLETKVDILIAILVLWIHYRVVVFARKAMATFTKGGRRQIQQDGVVGN